jgi:hypothetical protein
MKKPRKKLSSKSGRKRQRISGKNPLANALADKLSHQQTRTTTKKNLTDILTAKFEAKLINNFTDALNNFIVKNPNSALSLLNKLLPELGLRNLKEFMNEVDLTKLLTTEFNPKGKIFEVFVLKSKKMDLFLKSLAENSWKTMSEIGFEIGNVKGKVFDAKKFGAINFEIATDFRTHPDNLEFHDFGLVKYDRKTKELFLISGEIKEPAVAKKLPGQLARREGRLKPAKKLSSGAALKSSPQISFVIGGERIPVDSGNVFLAKDDSVGIARLKDPSDVTISKGNAAAAKLQIEKAKRLFAVQNAGDINFKSGLFEIVDFQPMLTTGKNPELFLKWILRAKTEITPDKIVRELEMVKKSMPKVKK